MNPETAKKKNDALMDELRGGMSERKFWATFVQCLICRAITLRKNFAIGHVCGDNSAVQPHASYPHSFDSPFGFPSSPTPTEVAEYDVFGEVDFNVGDANFEADTFQGSPDSPDVVASSDDIPSVLSDDSFQLPTLEEIMASVLRTVRFQEA